MVRGFHRDLDSFVRHSFAVSADQTTHVYRGTLFEYTTQAVLALTLGGAGLGPLTRVGGAADNGIDLVGEWQGAAGQFSVLVQCKSSPAKVAPRLWRELAGARLRLDSSPWLAIMAAPSAMTPKSLAVFNSLEIPLMHCRINQPPVLYNSAAAEAQCTPVTADLLSLCTNRAARTLFAEHGVVVDRPGPN